MATRVALTLLLLAGCEAQKAATTDDLSMTTPADQSMSAEDLATPDLAVEDMAMTVVMPDLTMRDAPVEDAALSDGPLPDFADAAVAPMVRNWEYFYDESEIHWLSTHGTGSVVPLASPAPQSYPFFEGDIDGSGNVTERRASVLYRSGTRLYRLEGRAFGNTPPSPAPVSSLNDIAQICPSTVQTISDMRDRTQSRLIFAYAPTGMLCSDLDLNTAQRHAVRLVADDTEAAENVVAGAIPLVGEDGVLEAVLRVDSDNLVRIASLTNGTTGATVVAAGGTGTVAYAAPFALGNHKFGLVVQRGTGKNELYIYDPSIPSVSALLFNLGDNYNIDPRVADDTYLYFMSLLQGGATFASYRVKLDGSAVAQKLVDSDGASAFTTNAVAVAGGNFFYTIPGTSGANMRSVPTSADFTSPPAATVVFDNKQSPFFVSSNRVFYQQGNFAGTAHHDGSDAELVTGPNSMNPLLSMWIGCTATADHILPRRVGLCDRALLLMPFSSGTPILYSFDADTGGSATGLLSTHAMRDEVTLGTIPGLINNARLVGEFSFTSYQRPAFLLLGAYEVKNALPDDFRGAIFYAPSATSANGLTRVQKTSNAVVWLSKR